MTIQRMDHVGVVVEDLPAAIEFFTRLGMESQGEGSVEGEWVDRIVGLDGIQVEMAMLGTPNGDAKIELVKFLSPPVEDGNPGALANATGIRHLCFQVEDVDALVVGLKERGGELVGDVVTYGDSYRLCYVRGPEDIIVELAEPLGKEA
jgi:catechol 2,3-dioxygenase-like lactoylglutathione lyase family enzyme